MKCLFLMCLLLLQAVYAAKNITLSIDVPQKNPADVSYVEGKAPEELKAGPSKNFTRPKETIAQAAFIRSSNREIPKDDEIENEEFERFIQKYHSGPTIETVFVSTSPSPQAEDSKELNEDTISEPEAEIFKNPSAQLRTFERSIAHPTLTSHILSPPDHHQTYAIVNHQPHDASVHNGGSASFSGSDGYVFQSNGGAAGNEGFILQSNGGSGGNEGFILQSSGGDGGQFVLTDSHRGGGGEQQYYQYSSFVPGTFNVAQNAVKTKTYEIRRPAIQKHYYDIEERVIVRPAGSIIVELDRPVAKVPTGETVIAVGGLTGSFVGNGFQQSSSQGGISFANGFGVNGGGSQGGQVGVGIQQSGGGFSGSGVTYTSSVGLPSISGSQGGQVGVGVQQSGGGFGVSQGGLSGSGITYTSSVGLPSSTSGSAGRFQQSQGALGGAQGGIGFQQSQGALGGTQGGIGFQQSQAGVAISTTTPSPNGTPTSTVVIGTQQQQGAIGASGGGFQQSQSGIVVTTTPAPSVTQTSSTAGTLFGGANGGFSGVGIQQSQGSVGVAQGGISGAGFQQSQGGATFSTTAAPGNTQTSSTTNIYVGGSNRGLSGAGFSQTQGGSSSFAGGATGGGFQQSQGGGVYSTTGVPFFQSTTPLPNSGGFSGVGFQQSQGGIGISQGGGFSNQGGSSSFQGGASDSGFQQSLGGGVYSTTGVPFFQSTTPLPNGGGFSGVGFQQSQGGIGISQGGGFSGAGFQQSQGGIYSTTPAPYLPPAAPTPTVLIGKSNGGFSGAGFKQSQGGIGISQGGLPGGFTGAGFQQSQGGIGLGGGFSGFQQSQGGIGLSQGNIGLAKGGSFGGGEIIYSTTASPSYTITGSRSILLRPKQGGGYPIVSTTTGGPIIISTLNPLGNNGNSFVVQANSNVQSKVGSVSSTTTTERSFSVSQDAAAFAKASSSGSIEAVSKHINPYKIAVQEPNFSYPPYVEISSNGSPLGHLTQQPYIQATSQEYPRMRYQGKLLTGEVHIDDGLGEQNESQQKGYGALVSHSQNYERPANVAEIPPNSPEEEQSTETVRKIDFSGNRHSDESHPQHEHQLVGSSKQPIQNSQISGGAHQQPDQIHQHHFLRATSSPIVIPTHNVEQHSAQQHVAQQEPAQQQYAQQNDIHSIAKNQNSAQQHVANHQNYPQYIIHEQQHPIQRANYQSRSRHYNDLQFIPTTPIHQQNAAQVSNQQPIHHNLVAQIRHQQLTPKQPPQVESHHQQIEHHQPTERTHSKQQQVTESLEEPIEVSEVHSSTHQQPTLFQQQVSPTVHALEPYNSGRRQYKQRGAPLKYTQDQSLNVVPSEHTVYFNNNLEHTSTRNQNVEIPSEPESLIEETTGKIFESSTLPIVTEPSTTTQRQTYASVLAQGKSGILYAPPRPVVSNHSPGHKQHFLRFSADGSSLFSPSGRQVHLVYSNPPPEIYRHQSQTDQSVPTVPIESAKQQISVTNKGFEAQLPITRQSQIELSASNKPAPASEPQITRSQSHAPSHQTSARYEAISSTTPEIATTKEHHKQRGPQKYRNEQTHGAITLRSGRTYGDHRVIASTPAPSNGGAASESVQTRRIVVNHPFQTIQEVVEREPFTNIHQVTVNAPAKQVQHRDGLQEGQQKSAAYRTPAPYKVAAQLNHPHATLSFHHGGSH